MPSLPMSQGCQWDKTMQVEMCGESKERRANVFLLSLWLHFTLCGYVTMEVTVEELVFLG